MATIATRLSNTGTLLVNGGFDENTYSSPLIAEALVIGGGGAGGHLGGGGAGGHRYFTNQSLAPNTNYTVTVGVGGSASTGATGNAGSNSVFDTYTSAGGGGGAGEAALPTAGGSGGGGGGVAGTSRPGAAGNTPSTSPSQGNAGGNGNDNGAGTAFAGGGGGGAGGTGDNASGITTAGNGGLGTTNSITGSSVTRAAGGGGGAYQLGGTGTAGTGGSSIGGNGGRNALNATSGSPNTGSGGGGNGYTSAGNLQGSSGGGGSGVVILKYPNTFTISNSGGGLTFTTDSSSVAGYNITTFTDGTGSISFTAPPKFRTTSNTVFSNALDEVSLASGSVSFSGSSQWLDVANTSGSSAFTFGTGDVTIECWVYHNTISGTQNYYRTQGSGANAAYLFRQTSGTLEWAVYNAVGTNLMQIFSATGALVANTWYHVAAVRYGNIHTIYINGQVSGTPITVSYSAPAPQQNIGIGRGDFSFSENMNGYISNLRVVKGTAIYTTNFTTPTGILPAVANTSLLLNVNDSTNFIKDNGLNKFTVTNNSTSFNANGPFNRGVTTVKQRQVTDGTLEVYSNFDEFTGAPVVDGSLQLWLDAGQTTSYPGSGTTWTDLTTKAYNYTLTSGPTYDTTNGGSINLAGASQYLASPVYPSATFTGAFSYEVWIKPTSTSGVILTENSTGNSSMTTWFVSLMELVTGSIRVGFWIGSAGYISIGTATANNWHQIVMTYSGTTLTGYVNGSVGNTGTFTKQYGGYGITTAPSGTNFGSGAWYNGKIASMKFYNRALSSDEVSQNFNALRRRYGI